ncbi:MAG: hypothetical protein COV71_03430 [Candidatus Omnitrophica bacterium CG11_big_fil_rev_8_21_14_0_20_41_12]|nr:MAG: hypothetical protein COV71_03430 [Candidatus Omnitrophica bacterium CG11_big_fil_rev_8_21_14_0_20_41_12]
MAKCPSCNKEIPYFYQIINYFKEPFLFWRNLFALPNEFIFICISCGEELNLTLSSCFKIVLVIAIASLVTFLTIFYIFQYFNIILNPWNSGLPMATIIFLTGYLSWRFLAKLKKVNG